MRLLRAISAITALAALAACQDPARFASTESPIIGGVVSTDQDYPSSGAVLAVSSFMGQQFGSVICTGTLIAPDVVLSAGHCTIDIFAMLGTPSTYYFTFTLDVSSFGMTTTAIPPRTTMVKKLQPHPNYDLNAQPPNGLGDNDFDIGLMFLEDSVADVVPEVVSDSLDAVLFVKGATVAIAGYGLTTPDGQEAGVKYHALTIINEVGNTELQIGDLPPRPQKCHGDSGGPTYLEVMDGRMPQRRLIGVTSRAYDESDCNKGGVDMRADAYRDWIEATMIAACGDGTRNALACVGGGGLPLPGGTVSTDAGVLPDTGSGMDAEPPPDTGVEVPDSGVVTTTDAEPASDAVVARDATGGGGGGGSNTRDEGCACSTSSAGGESVVGLLLLALVFVRRRS